MTAMITAASPLRSAGQVTYSTNQTGTSWVRTAAGRRHAAPWRRTVGRGPRRRSQYFVGTHENLLSIQTAVKISGLVFKARSNNEPIVCR
jgi:hypothetical protein